MTKLHLKIRNWVGHNPLRISLWEMRRQFITVGCLSATINAFALAPSFYMLQVFDRVLSSHNILTLLVLSLITISFFFTIGIAEWLRTRQLVQIGLRFETLVSSQVFVAALHAKTARSSHRADDAMIDLNNIRQFLTGNGLAAIFDLPWAPIYLLVMFMLHPAYAGLVIVGVGVLICLSLFQKKYSKEPLAAVQESAKQVNRFISGKLRNAEIIEALGMLDSLRKIWLERHNQYGSLQNSIQQASNKVDTFTKFIRYTLQSLTLGLGAILVISDDLSMGGMVVGTILLSKCLQPIETLIAIWKSMANAQSAFIRLETLLSDFPESTSGRPAEQIKQISLRALNAWSPDGTRQIFHDINLDLGLGQVLAILGASGSGKSTLARAIVGVWPKLDGSIVVNGRPRDEFDQIGLARRVGYVPQDIELFDGTIAQNIARFSEIDSEAVIRAATTAQLHELILRFPNGYDTPIGDAGSKLSGGQRQRIALARALYGNPDLIVLDEPNANLDDAGDRALSIAISELKASGKIVILISHRQQLLKNADYFLILKSGTTQFFGTANQLIVAREAAVDSDTQADRTR